MNVRLEATVRGRVQGVGFRFHVLRNARALGLTGWVANGSGAVVRCVAEGPRDALEGLLAILAQGPPGADVERVSAAWGAASGGFTAFDIRSGGHSGD